MSRFLIAQFEMSYFNSFGGFNCYANSEEENELTIYEHWINISKDESHKYKPSAKAIQIYQNELLEEKRLQK